MTLAERQEAMWQKQQDRRLKAMRKAMRRANAVLVKTRRKMEPRKKSGPKLPRPVVVLRATVKGDIPTAKLIRMEELAYRIARRKWQIA